MASSDHDIRYATELYDRQRTLNAIEQSGSRIENKLVEMNKSLQVGFSYILEGMDKQSGQLDNIGEVLLNMEGISEDIFDSVNDLHDSVNKGRGENVALQLANIYMTYNDTFRKSKRK